eukprot:15483329-Alexandrium_andersonii.AAC.1
MPTGTVSSDSDLMRDPWAGGGGTSAPMGVAGGGKGADTTGVGGMEALGTWADACSVKMGLLTAVPIPVVLGCTHSDT